LKLQFGEGNRHVKQITPSLLILCVFLTTSISMVQYKMRWN